MFSCVLNVNVLEIFVIDENIYFLNTLCCLMESDKRDEKVFSLDSTLNASTKPTLPLSEIPTDISKSHKKWTKLKGKNI